MRQLVFGLIAGLLGGLVVLLLGFRRPKAITTATAPPGTAWSRATLTLMYLPAALIPLIGFGGGLWGMLSRPKRSQGAFLFCVSIGATLVLMRVGVLCGFVFNLVAALVFLVFFSMKRLSFLTVLIIIGVYAMLAVSYGAFIRGDWFFNNVSAPLNINTGVKY